jgi:hypothetical protein
MELQSHSNQTQTQTHTHGPNCGHARVRHDGHQDYLQDGHLHHQEGSTVVEHVIAVSEINPERCTPDHRCAVAELGHQHGPGCGHEAVPHGNHTDYLVNGRLHHPHSGHCDDHGALALS